MRKKIAANPALLNAWDTILPECVHEINTRYVSHTGFTPAQAFLSFNPRRDASEMSSEDVIAGVQLREPTALPADLDEWSVYDRVDQVELMREAAIASMVAKNSSLMERQQRLTRWTPPQVGDLIVLKDHQLAKTYGR